MGDVAQFPNNENESSIFDSRGNLKGAYQPSKKVKSEWHQEGQRREDPGYQLRWIFFWGRVVRAVAALGQVGTTEIDWVERYVQSCRLAELHRFEALAEPYQRYESGYVAAHPGFAQARAEEKLARALASDLGLTPAKRRAAGIEVPRPDTADPDLDDQTGPDGEAL